MYEAWLNVKLSVLDMQEGFSHNSVNLKGIGKKKTKKLDFLLVEVYATQSKYDQVHTNLV